MNWEPMKDKYLDEQTEHCKIYYRWGFWIVFDERESYSEPVFADRRHANIKDFLHEAEYEWAWYSADGGSKKYRA